MWPTVTRGTRGVSPGTGYNATPRGDPEEAGSFGHINRLLHLNLKPTTVSNTGTQRPASIGSTHLTHLCAVMKTVLT